MGIIQKWILFFHGELLKIRKMTPRDQAWYIWEYYKIHILTGILATALLSSLIGAILDPSEIYLQCALINLPTLSDTEPCPLTDGFHAARNLSDNDVVATDILYLSSDDIASQTTYQGMQKLYARSAANELDLMFLPKADCEALAVLGLFDNLEELLSSDLWNEIKEYAIYVTEPETGISYPAALDISTLPAVTECGFIADSVVLSIAPGTQHLENCIQMIQYLFHPENS